MNNYKQQPHILNTEIPKYAVPRIYVQKASCVRTNLLEPRTYFSYVEYKFITDPSEGDAELKWTRRQWL